MKSCIQRCKKISLCNECKCTCSVFLSEYMLIYCIMEGVYCSQVKLEIFQNYDLYNNWDKLVEKYV